MTVNWYLISSVREDNQQPPHCSTHEGHHKCPFGKSLQTADIIAIFKHLSEIAWATRDVINIVNSRTTWVNSTKPCQMIITRSLASQQPLKAAVASNNPSHVDALVKCLEIYLKDLHSPPTLLSAVARCLFRSGKSSEQALQVVHHEHIATSLSSLFPTSSWAIKKTISLTLRGGG